VLPSKISAAQRYLVIGGHGLLGGELARRWQTSGRNVTATTRQSLDLAADVERWTPPPGGGVAVICAAIADQEKCRREPAATRRINVEQTIKLAKRLVDQDYFVVFLSTSLVFDGARPHPTPEDPIYPATEYGRQKAAAEFGLIPLEDDCAIVRLTKVVHEKLPLLAKWRELLARGESIKPFRNYICAPISLDFAVAGIAAIAEAKASGIWHLSAQNDLTYSDLARLLAGRYGFPESLITPADAPPGLLEHLPAHAALDASRAEEFFGIAAPEASAALDGFGFAKAAPPMKP
jgi:dTDP-4-dehydrorhamnose reductase